MLSSARAQLHTKVQNKENELRFVRWKSISFLEKKSTWLERYLNSLVWTEEMEK